MYVIHDNNKEAASVALSIMPEMRQSLVGQLRGRPAEF